MPKALPPIKLCVRARARFVRVRARITRSGGRTKNKPLDKETTSYYIGKAYGFLIKVGGFNATQVHVWQELTPVLYTRVRLTSPQSENEARHAGRHPALMPCYHPLLAAAVLRPSTWKKIPRRSLPHKLPCGRCIGCRLERKRQWAVRITHEAQTHDANSFLTLTYDDEHLPNPFHRHDPHRGLTHLTGTLDRTEFPRFMKRLRKKLAPTRVRYFHCGEYGDELERPHYHACLFGHDFSDDRQACGKSSGHLLYQSALLTKAWGRGRAIIGELTFDSAAYVAGYVTKKINGPLAEQHYERIDPVTGEIIQLEPEFATMSRGGRDGRGIGFGFFKEYRDDIYPRDEIISRGFPAKPPRAYDNWLEEMDEAAADKVRDLRSLSRDRSEETRARLRVREEYTQAQVTHRRQRRDQTL